MNKAKTSGTLDKTKGVVVRSIVRQPRALSQDQEQAETLLRELGEEEKAREELREALTLRQKGMEGESADPAIAHVALGDAYFELERYEDAIAEYGTALELKPDDARIHRLLGYAYY